MSYRPQDPREALGPPDVVLYFIPKAEYLERTRAGKALVKGWLDKLVRIPARGDRSPQATWARKRRAKLAAEYREKSPKVGGRLILKKRNTKSMARGKGKIRPGKTNLWRAFEAWALGGLVPSQCEPFGLRGLYPLRGRVHLAWRYHPPDRSAWPDHPGVAETVADLIQAAGFLENDEQIDHDDLSRRMGPDPLRPRLELWVREIAPDGSSS